MQACYFRSGYDGIYFLHTRLYSDTFWICAQNKSPFWLLLNSAWIVLRLSFSRTVRRLGCAKKMAGDTATTADPNQQKEYSVSCNIILSNKTERRGVLRKADITQGLTGIGLKVADNEQLHFHHLLFSSSSLIELYF